MKKLLFTLIISFLVTIAQGQTNVSGGIYTNTTWTLANSPYIVTDTVVVFPGVTLTIEPGVIVKFANNTILEIRNANLYAVGTTNDSITFTSNSTNPYAGIWGIIKIGIGNGDNSLATISYCNFKYGAAHLYGNNAVLFTVIALNTTRNSTIKHCSFYDNGVNTYASGAISSISALTTVDSCYFANNNMGICNNSNNPGNFTVTNSIFENNVYACYLTQGGTLENCFFCNNSTGIHGQTGNIIINCSFSGNQTGINNNFSNFAQLEGCVFSNNNIAIHGGFSNIMNNNYIFQNQVGIELKSTFPTSATNNIICNNSTYNVHYFLTSNTSMTNVCWGTTDSAAIATKIYDGYDNISLGLISFIPFENCDSSSINVSNNACTSQVITFLNTITKENKIIIYPNPFSTQTILQSDIPLHNATLKMNNIFGQTVAEIKNINGQSITLHRDNLKSGMYIIRLIQDNNIIATDKIIITE